MRRWRLKPTAEFLQWFGFGAAGLVWACQHVFGFGPTVARCGSGGERLGVDLHTWVLVASVTAITFVLAAEAAAAVTVWRTWGAEIDGPPPEGRRHFFALAALIGNLLFLVVIVLSTVSVLSLDPCRQA